MSETFKKTSINLDSQIIICPTCRGIGTVGWRTCPACRGMALGTTRRGGFLYWNYPLERYHLAVQKARRVFNKIRWITVLVVALNFFGWSIFGLITSGTVPALFAYDLSGPIPSSVALLFWFGCATLCYLWYRSVVEKLRVDAVEKHAYDESGVDMISENQTNTTWPQILSLPRAKRRSIVNTFTKEALAVLGESYALADKQGFNRLTPFHILFTLLTSNRIGNIFIRLGIPAQTIQKELAPLFARQNSTTGGTKTVPVAGLDVAAVLFDAYEEAYDAHQDYVSVTELLLAIMKTSPDVKEILYKLDIEEKKLLNAVEWARIRERLYRQYQKTNRAARHRSTHGMDRAMTAVATPYLNQYSTDVTLRAQFGQTETCVAREREIEDIFRVVEGGQENVLLVGDFGVGKETIVEGIAERMVADDVPARLQDKRMVQLDIASLLAGTTPAGVLERLERVVYEIARAGNVILFVHNIHERAGISAGGGQSLDVAGTLADYISGGRFMTFATTTTEAYAQQIRNSKLGTTFSKVDIREMDEDAAIQVLESKVGYIEYKQQVFFSYAALEKAVQLAKRFVHEVCLPGNALEVMSEAASFTRKKKGVNALVTPEEVGAVVAEKTNIPVSTVSADETTKLLHLEETMHERVVGQEEAVTLVANALRRARAEIRSQSRPIANFLFLGPTGVGKTELAKTIAEVYFGGENKMVRLDMSEYQDKSSIYRLIGAPNEKGTGVLTEAIRRSPFTLLLLDEIEKADKDILNLFLQVMDDGRLSDSTGHVVDFTNVILIATSNAGTARVQEYMREGISSDAIKDRLLHGELAEYFKPEFLNRFDGIVLFKPLDREAIKHVAALMLKRVATDLEAKGITLHVQPSALNFLADVGFDPEFGARPMRRALQERVENQLAELLLTGQVGRHSIVEIGEGGKIQVGAI